MSSRHGGRTAALIASCFFVTVSRGDRLRSIVLRPWQAYSLLLLALASLACGFASAAYLLFRDDVVSALLARQAEMQYAYEDRIAGLRGQIDRIASRQLLDQDTVEGRVHDLLSRQAQLESRASLITSLAALGGVSAAAPAPREASASINPLLMPKALPAGVSAFAPAESMQAPAPKRSEKPRPETTISPRAEVTPTAQRADAALNPDVPVPLRLEALSSGLERIEAEQMHVVADLTEATRRRTARLRAAIATAGLSPDRISPPHAKQAVGGPFVPVSLDPTPSPFEKQISLLQTEALAADRLNRAAPYLPLRKPLNVPIEVTSPFGTRVDPFLGRLALHTGVDLRDEYGSPVHATGAGTVASAGWNGGYGNMVEIDHGNGLTTRYGHLSSIAVSEGQKVEAGAVVGRLGSTGRSTGPHLHYEVRVDGEAVDPTRFLRAAEQFATR